MARERIRYDKRLFETAGWRRYLHSARFHWAARQLADMRELGYSLIEIGCHDGRLLEYVTKPEIYCGYDADWGGGYALENAREKYSGMPNWSFIKSSSPSDLEGLASKSFDVGVALETLEHIDPSILDAYIQQLSRVISGCLLITVPNEIGIVFLAKYCGKAVLREQSRAYSSADVLWHTLGQTDRVERNDHKGFNHRVLINSIREYFEIEQVQSLPFRFTPTATAFTIAIVATPKPHHKMPVSE